MPLLISRRNAEKLVRDTLRDELSGLLEAWKVEMRSLQADAAELHRRAAKGRTRAETAEQRMIEREALTGPARQAEDPSIFSQARHNGVGDG